jgi:hypothetical protein
MVNRLEETQVILVRLDARKLEHFKSWLNKDQSDPAFRERCTLSVPSFEFSPNRPLLALISKSDGYAIEHVAIAHRGHPRATDIESQIRFQYGISVEQPTSLLELKSRVKRGSVRFFTDELLATGGVLPPTVSRDIIAGLLDGRDNLRRHLERALQPKDRAFEDATEVRRFTFQQQKDAAQIAFQIAGLNRHRWLKFSGTPTLEQSFLDQLEPKGRGLTENTILNHDAKRFPFLTPLIPLHHTVARFGDERVRLDLIFAHSEKLEKVTGADLIYFNATYRAFVLVQYKALDEAGESRYKLDTRLAAQIAKMEKLRGWSKAVKAKETLLPNAYRLGEEFLFLKFCERQQDLIGDQDLIPGHYIPVAYFNRLNEAGILQGPEGGAVITKEALNRCLSNTEFTAMVKSAWIGSSIEQFAAIQEVIEANIADGRAMTVAVEERPTKTPRADPKGSGR